MKKILFLVIFSLPLVYTCKNNEQVRINVLSFNIRYDNPDDSLNNWKYRRDFASEMIRFYGADIIGAQEVLKNQLDDLADALPGFSYIGVGRLDGKEDGEFAPIFYNSGRFSVLESGHFWLSETPEVPGSKGWDAACERIVTWAVFKDKSSGKSFALYNTHFDHVGETAQRESAIMLLAHIRENVKEIPVVLTGDLNVIPGSEAVSTLLSGDLLVEAGNISGINYGPLWTFHDFGRIPVKDRVKIDYMFVSQSVKVESYATLSEQKDSVYLSDHNPVFAKLVLQ
ncbi:endonuclease/exonuclease/phosphatase family protein [Lentimicrobium sp.]|uniref:endonuclease/exonuclease/phosphatase family protein n=1 Tax=Lentimicrobium sp. TaxID=2034841 RepID=UPI0025D74FF1|nr:endonuclease/exonuclease/phosphatase family protein [Lentimicrobium sp.]MCO5256862.1 endonuclease/exonuclease/phosphatase family protein [Lentimicrobium sp.]HPR26988.1 endonuclease/exonuclease/phosphatase family protein [Lentimicrobium sp.]